MHIFSIIFPLIFIVALGFSCCKLKFFEQQHIAGLSKFTFYISLPAFLFLNMSQIDLQQSISLSAFLSFYIPVLSVFALGILVDRCYLAKQKNYQQHSVFGLASSYSNMVLVGIPIIIASLGKEMIAIAFMIITFHSTLLFALTYLIGAKGSEHAFSWSSFAKSMVLNPIVLSIGCGLILNVSGIVLFDNLAKSLELLATPAIACALFVLGANLAFYKIAANWQPALIASLMKIFLLPAGVFLIGAYAFELDREILNVLVLLSASPVGVNAYLIASQIGQHQVTLAGAVVLSTVLSVISFSFWLSVLL
ncbi:AEC family transporter [Pseudoalteromonas sp. SG44-1]|uniref:AEC family transporter n=1 Tax=unclassified Pseudoalteromonas TaxID=194690 RepID=UPI001600DA5B|nr:MULTISPECIES: AEC family transporter [unclassified Pseudoalteromonas]MBB1342373.1 AEC family transporter [Pseudoalteromonas sp. SR45-6]MBB1418305.1 AEC family transporter [Pseudoalteromonas sp. SG44-1]MBB1434467.1 AEC family transporter [Pseudoalteromonas sp. SG43-6]